MPSASAFLEVRFGGLYQPDISTLAESLVLFGRWSEEDMVRASVWFRRDP
jgi:hypothetical protein